MASYPDHPYRILIIGGSGSGRTNVLLNLININDQILTEFFYMSKIHLNQSIDCLSMEEKKQELKNQNNQKLSLIIHKQLMMSMKIWKIIIQKVLIMFDDKIGDMENNSNKVLLLLNCF